MLESDPAVSIRSHIVGQWIADIPTGEAIMHDTAMTDPSFPTRPLAVTTTSSNLDVRIQQYLPALVLAPRAADVQSRVSHGTIQRIEVLRSHFDCSGMTRQAYAIAPKRFSQPPSSTRRGLRRSRELALPCRKYPLTGGLYAYRPNTAHLGPFVAVERKRHLASGFSDVPSVPNLCSNMLEVSYPPLPDISLVSSPTGRARNLYVQAEPPLVAGTRGPSWWVYTPPAFPREDLKSER